MRKKNAILEVIHLMHVFQSSSRHHMINLLLNVRKNSQLSDLKASHACSKHRASYLLSGLKAMGDNLRYLTTYSCKCVRQIEAQYLKQVLFPLPHA